MSLKTKVKAGNITNLSDARYCAGMGVDWLSFPANAVDPTKFKEITDWVTGPHFILEVNDATSRDIIRQYPVTRLETGAEQMNLVDQLPGMEWFIRIPSSDWYTKKNELIKWKDKISYLVVELDHHDSQALTDMASHFKLLVHLHGNQSLNDLLSLPVEGINITGEDELKPGLKDFERLAGVLEELEVSD